MPAAPDVRVGAVVGAVDQDGRGPVERRRQRLRTIKIPFSYGHTTVGERTGGGRPGHGHWRPCRRNAGAIVMEQRLAPGATGRGIEVVADGLRLVTSGLVASVPSATAATIPPARAPGEAISSGGENCADDRIRLICMCELAILRPSTGR